MLFIIIGLIIAVSVIIAIILKLGKNNPECDTENAVPLTATTFLAQTKKLLVVAVVAVTIIFAGVVFDVCQRVCFEENYLKISGVVTVDEEGYPESHFVTLYENKNTNKTYTMKNVVGFYVFEEVEINNDGFPVYVANEGVPYAAYGPVYSVK